MNELEEQIEHINNVIKDIENGKSPLRLDVIKLKKVVESLKKLKDLDPIELQNYI